MFQSRKALALICLLLAAQILFCACTDRADRSDISVLSSAPSSAAEPSLSSTPDSSSTPSKASRPSSSSSRTVTGNASSAVSSCDEPVSVFPALSSYTPVSPDNYYYASRLSGSLYTAYCRLRDAAAVRMTGMINLGTISNAEAMLIYQAVKDDYPEYFWIPYTYLSCQNYDGTLSLAFEYSGDTTVSYLCDSAARKEMSELLTKQLKKISQEILNSDGAGLFSAYDLELRIHDWLCENVSYCSEAIDQPARYPFAYTAYGALVEGKAVCEGYSRAAQLLLNYFGVPCALISGADDAGMGHMWNLVNIGGSWYHMDVTWDDIGDKCCHHFFNLSDSVITRDRTVAPQFTADISATDSFNYKLPACTDEAACYFVVNQTGFTNRAAALETVYNGLLKAISAKKAGETEGRCEFAALSTCSAQDALQMANLLDFYSIVERVNQASQKQKIYLNPYPVSVSSNGAFTVTFRYR